MYANDTSQVTITPVIIRNRREEITYTSFIPRSKIFPSYDLLPCISTGWPAGWLQPALPGGVLPAAACLPGWPGWLAGWLACCLWLAG